MRIESCTIKDIDACASLLVKIYSEPEYGENWKADDACSYLKRFYTIEPSGCYVALEDNEITGAVFSYSYPWQGETLIYIQELFVSAKHRNKGIAKSLLKRLGNGKPVRAWLVANENSGASGFYKKMGFRSDGPYKFNYGEIKP
ncbi:MAG: GNAT family N-acetyltransferase [Pseudomonadota bacterium]